jgi:hypothetical protein
MFMTKATDSTQRLAKDLKRRNPQKNRNAKVVLVVNTLMRQNKLTGILLFVHKIQY